MFFNHLFSLTTLKNRLLNTTSFSQVYSGEKLPLHKFRKEGAMLSPLIAGLLAACGGGGGSVIVGGTGPTDGGGTPDEGQGNFTVHVSDGPIEGASIYIDTNGNGQVDAGDTRIAGTTDVEGKISVSNAHRGEKLIVDLEGAFDLANNHRFEKDDLLRATLPDTEGGIVVVSPITTLVELLKGDNDELTTDAALKKIFGEDTDVTESHINNPDNYTAPTAAPTNVTSKDPLAIREEISSKAIIAQKLLEQELADSRDPDDADSALSILKDVGDEGLQSTHLDTAYSNEVTDALNTARETSTGRPIANPDITRGENTTAKIDEDAAITIDVADWGFRDIRGNRDGVESQFASVTITGYQIADEANAAAGQFYTKGDAATLTNPVALNTPILFADLEGLVFVPFANKFGTVTITYTVNDGQDTSPEAVLTFEVESVNDLPTDIELGGQEVTAASSRYLLVDGEIQDRDGTDDNNGGVITATDVETDDASLVFRISGGRDAALFEVDASGAVKLRDSASAQEGGYTYQVVIEARDSDGGVSTKTFEIVQAGLVVTKDGANSNETLPFYTNGVDDAGNGILEEEVDGTIDVLIGTLSVEGHSGNDNLVFAIEGGDDADSFSIVGNELFYTGIDSGDFDGENPSYDLDISYASSGEHVADFTGQRDVSIDGAASTEKFAYQGGVDVDTLSVEKAAGVAAVRQVTVLDTVIYRTDSDTSISIASEDFQFGFEAGQIVALSDGTLEFVADGAALPANSYVLASVEAGNTRYAHEFAAPLDVSVTKSVFVGDELTAATAANVQIGDDTNNLTVTAVNTASDVPAINVDYSVDATVTDITTTVDTTSVADSTTITVVFPDATSVTLANLKTALEGTDVATHVTVSDVVGADTTVLPDGNATLSGFEPAIVATEDAREITLAAGTLTTVEGAQVSFAETVLTVGGETGYIIFEAADSIRFVANLPDSGDYYVLAEVAEQTSATDDTEVAVATDPSSATAVQNTGTQVDTPESLTFLGEKTVVDYTVRLFNVDDNEPVFESADTFSVAENVTPDVGVLHKVVANDLDGDTVTYRISSTDTYANGVNITNLFSIDATTGEITLSDFATANPIDFEANSSFTLTATASSTFPDGSTRSVDQDITIVVTNVNETPEAVTLDNQTFAAPDTATDAGVSVGRFSTTDVDANDTFTYAIVGGDENYFRVDGDELIFIDQAADADQLAPGTQYSVIVRSTDAGGLSTDDTVFTITVQGVFLTQSDADSTRVFSNGKALLDENQDGSSTAINLGQVGDFSGSNTFAVVGSSDFTIDDNNNLIYSGVAGDFEASPVQSVNIAASTTGVHLNQFTGRTDVSVDGIGSNTFSYSGGDVSGLTAISSEARTVDIAAGTIYLATSDKTISITAETDFAIGFGAGHIVVDAEGTISFEETVPAGSFLLASIAASDARYAHTLKNTTTDSDLAVSDFTIMEKTDDQSATYRELTISTSQLILPDGTGITLSATEINIGEGTGFLVADSDGAVRFETDLPDATDYYVVAEVLAKTADATDEEIELNDVAPIVPEQNAGTDVTDAELSYDSGAVTTEFYLTLGNIDDSAPVFAAAQPGADYTETSSTISGVPENISADTVLFTAQASDADNVEGATVRYRLISGDDTFQINNLSGEVSFLAGQADFENDADPQGSYTLTVQAYTVDADGNELTAADGFSNTTDQVYTVQLSDVPEAPTALSFARSSGFEDDDLGTVQVIDPDATNTYSYALVAGEGDAHNARFAIDATTGQISLVSGQDRLSPGDLYSVRVAVTDAAADNAVITQVLTFAEGTISLSETVTVDGSETTVERFSGYTDIDGNGLLTENANFQYLGKITATDRTLSAGSADNDQFLLIEISEDIAPPSSGFSQSTVNTAGKFITLNLNASNAITSISVKEALGADDIVVGRFSSTDGVLENPDRGIITYSGGRLNLDRTLEAGTHLVYVGDDSGNFEAEEFGPNGPELIEGTEGDDTLTARDGGHILIGGAGDDTITLGAGADRVLYEYRYEGALSHTEQSQGSDTIDNFEIGVDKLVLIDTVEDRSLAALTKDAFISYSGGSDESFGTRSNNILIITLSGEDDGDSVDVNDTYNKVTLGFVTSFDTDNVPVIGDTITLNFKTPVLKSNFSEAKVFDQLEFVSPPIESVVGYRTLEFVNTNDATDVEPYRVELSDVNEAPELAAGIAITNFDTNDTAVDLVEGDGNVVTLTSAMIVATDQDEGPNVDSISDADASQFTFTATGLTNGKLAIGDTQVTSFTLAQLRAESVTFVHDGGEQKVLGGADTPTQFTLTLSDSALNSDPVTFTIDITPVDDAVVVEAEATTLTITEGAGELDLSQATLSSLNNSNSALLTLTQLNVSDVDSPNAQIVFEITTAPANGAIYLFNGTDWTQLEPGSVFTKDDVDSNNVRLVHDGSENDDSLELITYNATDTSTPTTTAQTKVDGTQAAETIVVTLNVTAVNDAPTRAPQTTDGTKVDWQELVDQGDGLPGLGDGDITEAEFSEGNAGVAKALYTLTLNDIGVYDPDNASDTVTYTYSTQLHSDVVLQKLNGNSWETIAVNGTFTVANVVANEIRIQHLGNEPQASYTLGLTVADTDGASLVMDVTIDALSINDAPTDIQRAGVKVRPDALPGGTIYDFTATDEETSDQSQFEFSLAPRPGTAASADNAYFEFDGQTLKFKSVADLGNLELKDVGESYNIQVKVTDQATRDDTTRQDYYETFILPVRFFDVDWAAPYSDSDVDASQTPNITVGASSAVNVGTFKILPGINTTAQDTYTVTAPQDNDFGQVTVTAGTKDATGQEFTVSFTPSTDNEALARLSAGQTLDVDFTLTISYREATALDSDPLVQSTETFSVRYTGVNDAPTLEWDFDEANHLVFENDDNDAATLEGQTSGHWRLVDVDTVDAFAGLSAGTAANALTNSGLIFGNATSTYDVEGAFGTLTVRGDGTWTYLRDTDKIEAAAEGVGTDVFYVQVSDTAGADSGPTRIEINIYGENDQAVITATGDSDTNADNDDTTVAEAVTESTDFGTSDSGAQPDVVTQTVDQQATGTWTAHDVDKGAALRLIVRDGSDIGTIVLNADNQLDTGNSTTREYNGVYGDIVFDNDGTWTYTLKARAESIAEAEAPVESFDVQLIDEYQQKSEIVTIDITITGTNDAPTAMTGNTGGVTESGYRVDDLADTSSDDSALTEADPDTTTGPTITQLPERTDTNTNTERLVDRSDNDVLGTVSTSGTLDATDIDRIGTNRKASAIDTHSFRLLGTSAVLNAAAATAVLAAASDVDLTTSVTDQVTDDEIDEAEGDLVEQYAAAGTKPTVEYTQVGTYGSITVDKYTGEWTYILDNTDADTVALNRDETATDAFSILITDEEGAQLVQTLTVTVTGTADAPVLTGLVTDSGVHVLDFKALEKGNADDGTEVAGNTAAGKFTFSDDDAEDGALGAVWIADTPSIQGRWVSAEIKEGNDAAQDVIVDDLPFSVSAPLTTGFRSARGESIGSNNGNDNFNIRGVYGQLKLDVDGSWVYTLDDNLAHVEALAEGYSAKDTFEFRITDDRAGDINVLYSNVVSLTIDIEGANDAPTLNPKTSTSLSLLTNEDSTPFSLGGRLTPNDVDADSKLSFHYSLGSAKETQTTTASAALEAAKNQIAGLTEGQFSRAAGNDGFPVDGAPFGISYGVLNFARDGDDLKWEFAVNSLNNVISSLGTGQAAYVVVDAYLQDENGARSATQQLVITIEGRNDKPVITSTNVETIIVDEDDTDTGTQPKNVVSFSDLDDNDTPDTLNIRASVDTTTTLNYAAPVSANVTAAPTSATGGTAIAKGTGTEKTETTNIESLYGTFNITRNDVTGQLTWDYTPKTSLNNALKEGDRVIDQIILTVFDDENAKTDSDDITLSVTITGADDTPVLSGSSGVDDNNVAVAQDDGTGRDPIPNLAEGTITFTDADAEDENAGPEEETPTVEVSATNNDADFQNVNGTEIEITGEYGILEVRQDGSWLYHLDGTNDDVRALNDGETEDDVFYIRLKDDKDLDGDSDDTTNSTNSNVYTLTIRVTGTNDAPELSSTGSLSATITEDTTALTNAQKNGVISFSDPEDGASALNIRASVDSRVSDSSFTLNYANPVDANVTTAPTSATAGTAIGSSPTTIESLYGSFTITRNNTNGELTWDYTQKAGNNGLKAGDSVEDKILLTVFDGDGLKTDDSDIELSVTITGADDAPVLTGATGVTSTGPNAGFAVALDDGSGSEIRISGQFSRSDPDREDSNSNNVNLNNPLAESSLTNSNFTHDPFEQTIHDTAYGRFSIGVQGDWSYRLDGSNDDVRELGDGDILIEKLFVRYIDDTDLDADSDPNTTSIASNVYELTVRVTGINDAPEVSSATTIDVLENSKNVIDLDATDLDGDSLTWSLLPNSASNNNNLFAINATTGAITWIGTAPDHDAGNADLSYTVQAQVNDGTVSTAHTVTVTVKDANDEAPFVTLVAGTGVTGSAGTYEVASGFATDDVVIDADGIADTQTTADTGIVYSLTGTNAGAFTIDASTGEVTFDASPSGGQSYSFNIVATATVGSLIEVTTTNIAITAVAPGIDLSTDLGSVDNISASGTSTDTPDDDYIQISGEVSFASAVAITKDLAGTSFELDDYSQQYFEITGTGSTQKVSVKAGVKFDYEKMVHDGYLVQGTGTDVNLGTGNIEVYAVNSGQRVLPPSLIEIRLQNTALAVGETTINFTDNDSDGVLSEGDTLTATDINALGDVSSFIGTFSNGSNARYQWQSSSDGTTWTNIGAEVSPFDIATGDFSDVPPSLTLPDTVSDGNQFRLQVTGGGSGIGGPVLTTKTTDAFYTAVGDSLLPTLIEGSGWDADTITATTAAIVQGGAGDDNITASASGNIIAGGVGDDTITLAAGTDSVIYRFDGGNGADTWQGLDGNDTINSFERGVDKLVLVDTNGTPITAIGTFDTQIRGADTVYDNADDALRITHLDPNGDFETDGIVLTFANGGATLTLNFSTPVSVIESVGFINLEDLLDGPGVFNALELTTPVDIV